MKEKVLQHERDLYKMIVEKQTETMKKQQEIYTQAIKRKGEVLNKLQAEDVEDWIIELVKAI